MNPEEEARMAAILAAGNMQQSLINVPRPGTNPAFDAYMEETFGDDVDPEDVRELRRAAWRTWKTQAPSASRNNSAFGGGGEDHGDDELARALALSAQEHRANQGSSADSPIVLDDDNEEVQRAIALSTTAATSRRDTSMSREEREMEEAIAASLAPTNPTNTAESHTTVADEPEDDMDAAIKASLASFEADERERKKQKTESASTSKRASKAATPEPEESDEEELEPAEPASSEPVKPVGLRLRGLQIDRAQLERERLARQAARSGNTTPAPAPSASQAPSKPSSSSSSSRPVPPKPLASGSSSGPAHSSSSPSRRALPPPLARLPDHPLQSVGPFPRDAAGEYYLDGELRHVALEVGKRNSARTFSPRDVFGKHSEMSLLIISSYCWDNQWIDEDAVLPTADVVPTIRITRPAIANPTELRSMQGKLQPMADGEVRSYPNMDGRPGAEHMKFAWIFYKTGRLRVVIMTANMVGYDWASIENTVFVQDFLPRKSERVSDSLPDIPSQFGSLFARLKINKALKWLLVQHPMGKDIPADDDASFKWMERYDWSRAQVRIVMSVSGKFTGCPEMELYGLSRLSKVLRDEGWLPQIGEKLAVEYQGSSLGSYSSKWLNDFNHCCQGKDLPTMSLFKDNKLMPPVKIIFPSLATVDASLAGRPGGGTMFCGHAFKPATKELFHDANSKRGGVLMHTKMIIALFEPKPNVLGTQASSSASGKRKADDMSEGKDDVGGWVYVGSHNFSSSAWGTLNFVNKPPTLNISNYELGIVFPLPRFKAQTMANNIAAHQRPARPYGKTDVPWSQNEHMK